MPFENLGSMRIFIIRICASLVLTLCIEALADSKVYRYVDENGVVSFSANPPTNETEAEQVDIPKGNIITKDKLSKEQKDTKRQHELVNARINRIIDENKKRASEIAEARQEIKKKRAELEQGQVPLPGERVGTVFDHTRLRPSYHKRIKALEDALAKAEEELKKLESK